MKVGIIGGGASGMVAAIFAAKQGANVTIFEQADRVGKKLLMTGNGRCNYTNLDQDLSHYHGLDPTFAESIFYQFSMEDTLSFFASLGILKKEKNGYVYPYSEQASAILDVLRMELAASRICVICEEKIRQVQKKKQFMVKTSNKTWFFDSVIVATGSMAANLKGVDESGYHIASAFGHTVRKPLPALVSLRTKEAFFTQIAGVRCDARLTLYVDEKVMGTERGELQITSYGISGIVTFQLSHIVARSIAEQKKVRMQIDFMPQMNEEEFSVFFKDRILNSSEKLSEELLIGMLNKKLSLLLLKEAQISPSCMVNQLSKEKLKKLEFLIKNFSVKILETNSMKEAQVACGGIVTGELTSKLESKLVKGLYFCGEIIDIHGDCGGYNLQWAWSSGAVAGRSAATC